MEKQHYFRMHRRTGGGKRIRMDDPPVFEEDQFQAGPSSAPVEEQPHNESRMTRLRARGGVRDRPPIIDEDDEDMFQQAPPIVHRQKRKATTARKPPAEKIVKEKEVVEKIVDRERDVTQDETSLYFIVRHSKSPIAVLKLIRFFFCF